MQIERADDAPMACALGPDEASQAVPQRRGLQLGALAVSAVDTRHHDTRRGAPSRREHAAAGPQAAVGERQQRLVRALALADRRPRAQRPARVGRDDRQRAAAAQRELPVEQPAERSGPPPSARTPAGTPAGSTPTETARWRPLPRRSGASSRCPARPPSGPSSSPTISTCSGADAALPQMREIPARGVGLVGEADLDVLGVARHATRPCSPASRRRPRRARPRPCSPSRSCSRRRASTAASSSAMRAFGGSAHSGLRDQVDLAAVEPLRDDPRLQPAARPGARP